MRVSPAPTLVSRYLTLVAELADEREQSEHAVALAEALLPNDPDQALSVAHMTYKIDPRNGRALDVMIAVMTGKGRLGKAEVLRNERAKLGGGAHPTEVLSREELAGHKPAPLNIAAEPQQPTLRMNEEPIYAVSPDVSQAPHAYAGGARDGLGHLTLDEPPAGAGFDLGRSTTVDELFPIAAHGAPAPRPAALAAAVQTPAASALASTPPAGLSPVATLALFDAAAPNAGVAPPLASSPAPAATALPAVASGHGSSPSPPSDAAAAQMVAAHAMAAQAMAAQAFAAQAFSHQQAQRAEPPPLPASDSAFWAPIQAELLRLARSPAVVDAAREALAPQRAGAEPQSVDLPFTHAAAAEHLAAILTALPADASAAQRTAASWDFVQSRWGAEPSEDCARFLAQHDLGAADPRFFGLYLDALSAQGSARRALNILRRTLAAHPQLAWANAGYRRLPALYQALGLKAFIWSEDEGVEALRQKLEQRAEPSLRAMILATA